MATRIHVLLARDAPTAVVLRRGPTKRVRMLVWDRRTDNVQRGQWLAGRVFTDRCDLSPDGQLLVYLATRRGDEVWTAMSRPPYFTPLAVWKQSGTCGGGGLFVHRRALRLNAWRGTIELEAGFTVPSDFEIVWSTEDETSAAKRSLGGPRPGSLAVALGARAVVVNEPGGSRWASEYTLSDGDREQTLGVLDWADWDVNGDLLFAKNGDLVRAKVDGLQVVKTKSVAQLADDCFERVPPPASATRWPR